MKKGVFPTAKFDSVPELLFARNPERDEMVKNWLRPAKTAFNITYHNGRHYETDFVVETDDPIYLVKVKGEDKLNEPSLFAEL